MVAARADVLKQRLSPPAAKQQQLLPTRSKQPAHVHDDMPTPGMVLGRHDRPANMTTIVLDGDEEMTPQEPHLLTPQQHAKLVSALWQQGITPAQLQFLSISGLPPPKPPPPGPHGVAQPPTMPPPPGLLAQGGSNKGTGGVKWRQHTKVEKEAEMGSTQPPGTKTWNGTSGVKQTSGVQQPSFSWSPPNCQSPFTSGDAAAGGSRPGFPPGLQQPGPKSITAALQKPPPPAVPGALIEQLLITSTKPAPPKAMPKGTPKGDAKDNSKGELKDPKGRRRGHQRRRRSPSELD